MYDFQLILIKTFKSVTKNSLFDPGLTQNFHLRHTFEFKMYVQTVSP